MKGDELSKRFSVLWRVERRYGHHDEVFAGRKLRASQVVRGLVLLNSTVKLHGIVRHQVFPRCWLESYFKTSDITSLDSGVSIFLRGIVYELDYGRSKVRTSCAERDRIP